MRNALVARVVGSLAVIPLVAALGWQGAGAAFADPLPADLLPLVGVVPEAPSVTILTPQSLQSPDVAGAPEIPVETDSELFQSVGLDWQVSPAACVGPLTELYRTPAVASRVGTLVDRSRLFVISVLPSSVHSASTHAWADDCAHVESTQPNGDMLAPNYASTATALDLGGTPPCDLGAVSALKISVTTTIGPDRIAPNDHVLNEAYFLAGEYTVSVRQLYSSSSTDSAADSEFAGVLANVQNRACAALTVAN